MTDEQFWQEIRCGLKMIDAASPKELHPGYQAVIRAIEKKYPELVPPQKIPVRIVQH